MRRLLLLLLTLLIPLQLLAATGELQLRERLREQLPVAGQVSSSAHGESCLAADARWTHALVDLSGHESLSGDEQSSGSEDDDQPTAQGELEDPALPVAIATPGLHWMPFPHAFPASLSWSSFLRDQLRPPPLA
ncbi:hypothetical protein HBDW_18280 [Herbaspirillum sp. DW155]|uniref:hypothetical protein n=1 Tax=Herbaspirillum sp. DW155 TaxID=3095609 RepID=UPI0030859F3F|nr:hypothetical protein HBDW_18280 [Herbaspirillum sp. DW155]